MEIAEFLREWAGVIFPGVVLFLFILILMMGAGGEGESMDPMP